jgi:hypothetical protein
LLDYYFDAAEHPSWKYFANYAEKVVEAIKRTEEDKKERMEMRKRAREWVNE